jgi:uncharacterized protein (TIGR03382 family)
MRLLASIVLLACALPSVARADDSWSDPYPGVRRLHRVTGNQNINVLVVDLCTPGVSVRATKSDERQRTVSSFGNLVGAQAAINGDFFSYENYSTNGPAGGEGAMWGGSDHGYVAPVQFGDHHAALPGHESQSGVESWAREVVSGHPTLIAGGAPRDNNGDTLCTARHPRTALGFSADHNTLYLAVIDGRATNRIGMTCDEMIGLFQELGAADAVNMDGGGSSTMWLASGGVLNYPSDGSQRVVGNHLAVRAAGGGDAPNCPNPTYQADFVAAGDAPLEMTSGDEAVVWMDYTNNGNTTWDLDLTRVGTQDPQDRASAFFKDGNWLSPSRASGADHSNYGPGAVGRFTWVMLAPEVDHSTQFEESFQLVQEGVTWFGPVHTMSIIVHPRSGPTPLVDAGAGPGGDDDDDGGDDGGSGGCNAGGSTGGLALALLALGVLRRQRRA